MQAKPRTPEETYGPALEKALRELRHLVPGRAAAHAAVTYQADQAEEPEAGGHFQIPFFGRLYEVAWPGGQAARAADGQAADIPTRILLLHYLLQADGTPLADRWIAFRNLPGGLGYDAAFQGRTARRLIPVFGQDGAAFEAAARALGGEPLTFGDRSFLFRLLPRVWLAVVLYLADDEFPANVNVLFDAAVSHYLPTEDLAVLGGMLAGRLIRAAR